MNAAARLKALLHAPTVPELIEPLPAIADLVAERLEVIALAPSVSDIDALLRELNGLAVQLTKLRLALKIGSGVGAGGAPTP